MIRWLVRILFVVVLGGLALGAAAWYSDRGEKSANFRTVSIRRGDILATISATGTLEPEEVVDVGAQVAGQIISFGTDIEGKMVDYGSVVDEGSILAQIDDSLYQADKRSTFAQIERAKAGVQRAQADINQLQAKLVQAERDWERAQKLGSSEALAQTSFDSYKAAFEIAKANIAVGVAAMAQAQSEVIQAEAALVRIERNLTYCTIKSPVRGVIIDRRVNIGQTVVASLNAPSLFLIAKDLKRMELWVAVNEADIGQVHPGQNVTFTVDAFAGQSFRGKVEKVRLNAVMTQNVVTYTVEVATDNPEGKLLPYLTANVQFETGYHENTLLVPNAALRWTPRPELIAASESSDAETEPGEGRGRRGGRGASAGGGPTTRHAPTAPVSNQGTLWVQAGEFVRPIRVVLGLNDGANTEVIGADLSEDMKFIVGEQRAEVAGPVGGAPSPFMPTFPGRGGGGGGGGRRGG